MTEQLLKFLPIINFAPDGEGEGGDAGESTDTNDSDAEARIKEELHPEETTLYNEDGSAKKPEDNAEDKEGDDKDGEDDAEDKEGDDKDGEDDAEELDPDEVPEDGVYKIDVPEGMEVDQDLLDEMAPHWKEKGTTRAEAQALADKYIAGLNKQAEAIQDTQAETINTWLEESTNDKDFGGANLDQNVALGRKALEAYGDDGLKKLMVETGVGNNLSMLKFMAKVGATVADDDVPGDGQNPQSNMNEAGDEETLYGATTPSKRV